MHYEQLLDEIMINTLSAKGLIGTPQREFHYAVCPWNLEFHTTIFLSSILLSLDQHQPLILLIQVDELPESAMRYTGEIWPHFGRKRNFKAQHSSFFEKGTLTQTTENPYPYLDKLFCYLSVINVHQDHLVLFVKTGEKNWKLTEVLKPLLEQDYSLLVISNCYDQLPSERAREKSTLLIQHLKTKSMNEEEQCHFPAFHILSDLLPEEEHSESIEQMLNTADLGLDSQCSSSLWRMLR